jgi:transcription initiation factor TFIIIB Brf1 subunit/transcription initiation factor TFIIB
MSQCLKTKKSPGVLAEDCAIDNIDINKGMKKEQIEDDDVIGILDQMDEQSHKSKYVDKQDDTIHDDKKYEDIYVCHDCGKSTIFFNEPIGTLECDQCGYIQGKVFQISTFHSQEIGEEIKGNTVSQLGSYQGSDKIEEYTGLNIQVFGSHKGYRRLAYPSNRVQRKSVQDMIREIRDICRTNELRKSIADTAINLYRDHVYGDIYRRGNYSAVKGACIYLACKKWKAPRTEDEISQFRGIRIKTKILNNMIRTILKTLTDKGLHQEFMQESDNYEASIIGILSRFESELNMPEYVKEYSHKILITIVNQDLLDGFTIISICATVIVIALNKYEIPYDLKQIKTVTTRSIATIKKGIQKIEPYMDKLEL